MIKRIRKNVRCNYANCDKLADLEIDVKKKKSVAKIFLCEECFKKMYFAMGSFVAPKSPQNILNRFKK